MEGSKDYQVWSWSRQKIWVLDNDKLIGPRDAECVAEHCGARLG